MTFGNARSSQCSSILPSSWGFGGLACWKASGNSAGEACEVSPRVYGSITKGVLHEFHQVTKTQNLHQMAKTRLVKIGMAHIGIEPVTLAVLAPRSMQLS